MKNTGKISGDEVVELYLTQPHTDISPRLILAGFTRVHLEPNQSTKISFDIDQRSLGEVGADGELIIQPGEYTVSLGGSQPGGQSNTPTAAFTIKGRQTLPK